ncbi:MAG: hypothetical protein Kow0074_02390 [Candidatus Zixiibacteriota bacterium]
MATVLARGEYMTSSDSERSRSALRHRRRFDSAVVTDSVVVDSRLDTTPSRPSPADCYPQESLQRISDRLREALRCDAVAIRLVGRNKELRYAASSGRTFAPDIMSGYDHSGRPLCVCDQVCRADFDRNLTCFTASGTFVVNSLPDTLALRRRATAPRFNHLLNGQAEYQSLVVTPIRASGIALGVVQCADSRPHRFDAQAIQLVESVVAELANDIYYDSLWQPRSCTNAGDNSEMSVACPICGRERDQNGIWHTECVGTDTHRRRRHTRHVVCPSCLRLCNFE